MIQCEEQENSKFKKQHKCPDSSHLPRKMKEIIFKNLSINVVCSEGCSNLLNNTSCDPLKHAVRSMNNVTIFMLTFFSSLTIIFFQCLWHRGIIFIYVFCRSISSFNIVASSHSSSSFFCVSSNCAKASVVFLNCSLFFL